MKSLLKNEVYLKDRQMKLILLRHVLKAGYTEGCTAHVRK